MSYVHSKYEVEMIPANMGVSGLGGVQAGATLASPGTRFDVTVISSAWGPGFVPHVIKAAAIILTGTNLGVFSGAPPEVLFEADISTPGTVTTLFTIGIPTAVTDHSNKAIYHVPTYYIELKPGMQVQTRVSTAATAGVRGRVMLYVEPRWEEAANVTTMLKAT